MQPDETIAVLFHQQLDLEVVAGDHRGVRFTPLDDDDAVDAGLEQVEVVELAGTPQPVDVGVGEGEETVVVPADDDEGGAGDRLGDPECLTDPGDEGRLARRPAPR